MNAKLIGWILIAGVLACGCPDGSTSRLDLTITFPDAGAKAEAVMVRALVLKPAEASACADLLAGTALPGDDGYAIEDQISIILPAEQGDDPLTVKGKGPRLFYAEASDVAGEVFLRGCTAAEARPEGVTQVTIALLRTDQPCTADGDCDDGLFCTGVESCQTGFCSTEARDCDDSDPCTDDACDEDADSCVNAPVTTAPAEEGPEGDLTCSDGVDNDCDGSTDAADSDCAACTTDADCNDGLYCTGDETCDNGSCVTAARDCDDTDFCTDDACDEDADTCVHDPVANPPGTEGPVGDPTCDDGIDNDCDGLTDSVDTACVACTADAECDDQNDCTADSCPDGICVNDPVTNGDPCDDGDTCTASDSCTDGSCSGTALDCSHLDDQCLTGACDAGLGDCVAQPKAPGTACEDGEFCSSDDQCDDVGACQAGAGSPCTTECLTVCDEAGDGCLADAPGTPCTDDGTYCNGPELCDGGGTCASAGDPCGSAQCGACDEQGETCNISPGLACDDGVACTENDECDAAGDCAGTPNDGLCGAGEVCSLACFSGCGLPPDGAVLSCDSPVSLAAGNSSACTLVLSGGDNTGQAVCLSCAAEVGMSLLEDTSFDDGSGGCTLNGWTLGTDCKNSVAACDEAGGPRGCCEQLPTLCDTTTFGRPVLRSDEATNCSNAEQWRLSKPIDLSGVTNPRVCVELADQGAQQDSALILFAGTQANPYQDAVVCSTNLYQDALGNLIYRTCAELPAWTENNPDVLLTFIAHSENNGNVVFLAGVQVSGWVLGCAIDVVAPLVENFDSCDLSAWSASGTPDCQAGVGCANDTNWQPGVFSTSDDLSLETLVDTTELDGVVEVCFQFGSEAYTANDALTFWYDAGAGPQAAWASVGVLGADGQCGATCLDLAQLDPTVRNNPALGLGFDLPQASSIGLFGVVVQGSRHCAAQAGEVDLSALVEGAVGQYAFTATDTAGTRLSTQLSCTWQPTAVRSRSSEVSFTP